MSDICIAGNSSAVIRAIEEIKTLDAKHHITLICTESVLPYERQFLPELVAGVRKENSLWVANQSFFAQHNVTVIANDPLARISFKRHYVTTESKAQVKFDKLLLCDSGAVTFPVTKGVHKKGVFDALRFPSVKELIKYAPLVDTIFVQVTNVQGLNMACALSVFKKEIVIVAPQALLSSMFDDETASLLKQILETQQYRVITGATIEELIGDEALKAVKLSNGKLMAAQAVVFDNIVPDVKILADKDPADATPIFYADAIAQGAYWQAQSMPDDLRQVVFGMLQAQGDNAKTQESLPECRFGLGVLKGYCVGKLALSSTGREYMVFDGPANIYKKIYCDGDVVVGGIVFNAPDFEVRLREVISCGENLSGKEEQLLRA